MLNRRPLFAACADSGSHHSVLPEDLRDLADQIAPWHRAPEAGVARGGAVVAQQEILAARHMPAAALVIATPGTDVGLGELPAVDEDEAAAFADRLPRQPDQALHEGTAGAADLSSSPRRPEDDDVAPSRFGREGGYEQPVGVRGAAADRGLR